MFAWRSASDLAPCRTQSRSCSGLQMTSFLLSRGWDSRRLLGNNLTSCSAAECVAAQRQRPWQAYSSTCRTHHDGFKVCLFMVQYTVCSPRATGQIWRELHLAGFPLDSLGHRVPSIRGHLTCVAGVNLICRVEQSLRAEYHPRQSKQRWASYPVLAYAPRSTPLLWTIWQHSVIFCGKSHGHDPTDAKENDLPRAASFR